MQVPFYGPLFRLRKRVWTAQARADRGSGNPENLQEARCVCGVWRVACCVLCCVFCVACCVLCVVCCVSCVLCGVLRVCCLGPSAGGASLWCAVFAPPPQALLSSPRLPSCPGPCAGSASLSPGPPAGGCLAQRPRRPRSRACVNAVLFVFVFSGMHVQSCVVSCGLSVLRLPLRAEGLKVEARCGSQGFPGSRLCPRALCQSWSSLL